MHPKSGTEKQLESRDHEERPKKIRTEEKILFRVLRKVHAQQNLHSTIDETKNSDATNTNDQEFTIEELRQQLESVSIKLKAQDAVNHDLLKMFTKQQKDFAAELTRKTLLIQQHEITIQKLERAAKKDGVVQDYRKKTAAEDLKGTKTHHADSKMDKRYLKERHTNTATEALGDSKSHHRAKDERNPRDVKERDQYLIQRSMKPYQNLDVVQTFRHQPRSAHKDVARYNDWSVLKRNDRELSDDNKEHGKDENKFTRMDARKAKILPWGCCLKCGLNPGYCRCY